MKNKYNGFKEKWHNPKEHAKMSLTFYGIFFLVIFVLIVIANNIKTLDNTPHVSVTPSNIIKNVEVRSIYDMQQKLIHNSYSFDYTVVFNEKEYNFSGDNNLGEIKGFKETKEKLIRYKIIEDVVYEVRLDEEIIIDNFYEELNSAYLDPIKIFDLLDGITVIKSTLNNDRIFNYNIDETINIKIKSNNTDIKEIEIKENNNSYYLKFN